MDTVHAARKAAPDYSAFYTHPIDRISEAQSQIKSLALLLDYALEKDNEHKDGLTFTHLANCLGAIASLAEHIREAVDEIVDAENMATFGSPKSKEAA